MIDTTATASTHPPLQHDLSAGGPVGRPGLPTLAWDGPLDAVAFDETGIRRLLLDLDHPLYAVEHAGRIGLTSGGQIGVSAGLHPGVPSGQPSLVATVPALPPERLGDPAFRRAHSVRLAYAAGPMANGIASEELVIALGQAGILASFGAAGLVPSRLEGAIARIKAALPDGPFAFNLIHSPNESAMEQAAVDLYRRHGITTVEASAYLGLTPQVIEYRASGLRQRPDGSVEIGHQVIAKVSRREVATKFLEPAPAALLGELVADGRLTEQQAALAQRVPMCDDLTVEADSGGHTDNRPLVCLLPSMLELRDEIQARHGYPQTVRVGAAGGIATPASVIGAFAMGAAFVVTGSINQSCVESGASPHTEGLLAQAEMADVVMAPAADMFEMGVRVQLLKRGTLFPMRAQKLYDLYQTYDSIDAIPQAERQRLERQVFRRSLEEVWEDTVTFFTARDPEQLERAAGNSKRKMALIFRWYLGLSSRWSNVGEAGREMDYQIWCGPAMGAFNDWVSGTSLEQPANRRAAEVADHLMRGAALLQRVDVLRAQGVLVARRLARYRPDPA